MQAGVLRLPDRRFSPPRRRSPRRADPQQSELNRPPPDGPQQKRGAPPRKLAPPFPQTRRLTGALFVPARLHPPPPRPAPRPAARTPAEPPLLAADPRPPPPPTSPRDACAPRPAMPPQAALLRRLPGALPAAQRGRPLRALRRSPRSAAASPRAALRPQWRRRSLARSSPAHGGRARDKRAAADPRLGHVSDPREVLLCRAVLRPGC